MNRVMIILGALNAAFAVIMGAFSAHALKAHLEPRLLDVLQTGVTYHFYHALGLIVVGALMTQASAPARLVLSGWLLLAGVVLFSGSLYLLALTGHNRFGMITPLGGMAFIAGWLWLAWCYLKA